MPIITKVAQILTKGISPTIRIIPTKQIKIVIIVEMPSLLTREEIISTIKEKIIINKDSLLNNNNNSKVSILSQLRKKKTAVQYPKYLLPILYKHKGVANKALISKAKSEITKRISINNNNKTQEVPIRHLTIATQI